MKMTDLIISFLSCLCRTLTKPAHGHIDGLITQPAVYLTKVRYSCDPGFHLTGPADIYCNENGQWNDTEPTCIDTDECARPDTNNCHWKADCNNTIGSFSCRCMHGFTGSGTQCSNIDECTTGHPCHNTTGGVAFCFDTYGSYKCVCRDGWTGSQCEKDIDECALKSCGVDAKCTNTNGSFICNCPHGYQGDPHFHCYEKNMIEFNTTHLLHGHSGISEEVMIQFPDKFPYFGERFTSFRVSTGGFLSFSWYRFYTVHPPQTPQKWKDYCNPASVIAPFWANLITQSVNESAITFDVYRRYGSPTEQQQLAKIDKVFDDSKQTVADFKSRVAIVASWINATFGISDSYRSKENASFQAILSSDGLYTYGLFIYDIGSWTMANPFNSREYIVGYSLADKTGEIYANRTNYSDLNKKSNFPNGTNGYHFFNFTGNVTDQMRNESYCIDWSHNDTAKRLIHDALLLADPCPCFQQLMQDDYTFREYSHWYTDPSETNYKTTCYKQYFPNFNDVTQECCYKYGALAKSAPNGGVVEFVKDPIPTLKEGFQNCCPLDHQYQRLCRYYYEMAPSDDCSRYTVSDEAVSYGDPRLKTLDGKVYSFNGRGEYVLMRVKNRSLGGLEVQARTELAVEGNYDATVFVAFAAMEINRDRFEIILNRTALFASMFVNGRFVGRSSDQTSEYRSRSLVLRVPNNETVVAVFPSGFVLKFIVDFSLGITVTRHSSGPYRGQLEGLLGNYDGDTNNDFVLRDGTRLSATSSEQELFNFGQSWSLQNESESLFTYNITGKSFEFYNNYSIVPTRFPGDLLNNLPELFKGYSYQQIQGFYTLCGGSSECLIDIAVFGNTRIGIRERNLERQMALNSIIAGNKPPSFMGLNKTIRAIVNQATTISFYNYLVDDHDTADSLRLVFDTNIPSKHYVYDPVSKVFSWTPKFITKDKPLYLKVYVADTLNATAYYWPEIQLCACYDASECLFDKPLAQSMTDHFALVSCNCKLTESGDFCDQTVDICDVITCFSGVSCDSRSSLNNPCGACPSGMVGDGISCIVSELQTNVSCAVIRFGFA